MEHFYTKIQGWFTYPQLYKEMVNTYPSGSKFVEVGSWKGTSAAFMAVEIINADKNIILDCVDLWTSQDNFLLNIEKEYRDNSHNSEWLYNTFLNNISPVKHYINPIRSFSNEAASLYKDDSVDFCFIDAAHDYDSVLKDLTAWYPKIKLTGTFAGHDYPSKEVREAVNDFFRNKPGHIRETEQCWRFFRTGH